MSALLRQTEFVTANPITFAPAPMALSTYQGISPVVVPSGQKHTCIFAASVTNKNATFTNYPPQNDNERLFYTYASFREEPIAALAFNRRHDDTWMLFIPVPIPSDTTNPTLLALNYMIKYATTYDNGNSTIQTDAILSPGTFPEGVLTDSYGIVDYKNRMGYGARMIDHDVALRLSTTLAIKYNGGGEQWSHYIDNQLITPNIRILDAQARLYVVLHVNEYPTAKTVRSLSVEVSATWQKGEEVVTEVEEETVLQEEPVSEEVVPPEEPVPQEETPQEETVPQEQPEEPVSEEPVPPEEPVPQEETPQEEPLQEEPEEAVPQEEPEEQEQEEEPEDEPTIADAPDVADEKVQDRIKETMERLGIQPCGGGFAFQKTEWGYQCEGGNHKVTWEELGMN